MPPKRRPNMSGSWSSSGFAPIVNPGHSTLVSPQAAPASTTDPRIRPSPYAAPRPDMPHQALGSVALQQQATNPIPDDPRLRLLASGPGPGKTARDPRIWKRQVAEPSVELAPSSCATRIDNAPRPSEPGPSSSADSDALKLPVNVKVEPSPVSRLPSPVARRSSTPIDSYRGPLPRALERPWATSSSTWTPNPPFTSAIRPSDSRYAPRSPPFEPRTRRVSERYRGDFRTDQRAVDYRTLYENEREKLISLGQSKDRVLQDLHSARRTIEKLKEAVGDNEEIIAEYGRDAWTARRTLKDSEQRQQQSFEQLQHQYRQTVQQLRIERTQRARVEQDLAHMKRSWSDLNIDKLKKEHEDFRVGWSCAKRMLEAEQGLHETLKGEYSALRERYQLFESEMQNKVEDAVVSRDEVEDEKRALGQQLDTCVTERDEARKRAAARGKRIVDLDKLVSSLEKERATAEATQKSLEKDLKEKIFELDAFRQELAKRVTQCEAYDALVVEATSEYDRLSRHNAGTINNLRTAVNDIRTQLTAKTSQCNNLEDDLATERQAVASLSTQLEKQEEWAVSCREGLNEKATFLEAGQKNLVKVRAELKARTTEAHELQQDLDTLSADLAQATELASSNEKEIKRLSGELDTASSAKETAQQALALIQEELRTWTERTKGSESALKVSRSELRKKKTAYRDLVATLGAKESDISGLSTKLADQATEIKNLQEELANAATALDNAQSQLQVKEHEHKVATNDLSLRLEQKTKEIQDLEAQANAAQVELEKKAVKCGFLKNELDLKKADLETLRHDLQQKTKAHEKLKADRKARRNSKIGRLTEEIGEKEQVNRELRTLLTAKTTEMGRLSTTLNTKDLELAGLRRVVETTITQRRLADMALSEQAKLAHSQSQQLESNSAEIEEVRLQLEQRTAECKVHESTIKSLHTTVAVLEADVEALTPANESHKPEPSPIADRDQESVDALQFLLKTAHRSLVKKEDSLKERDADLEQRTQKAEILVEALDVEVKKTEGLRAELKELQGALAVKNAREVELGRQLLASRRMMEERNVELSTALRRSASANGRNMVLALALQSQSSEIDLLEQHIADTTNTCSTLQHALDSTTALLKHRERHIEAMQQLREADGMALLQSRMETERAIKDGNDALISQGRRHRSHIESLLAESSSLRAKVTRLSTSLAIESKASQRTNSILADKDADVERLEATLEEARDQLDVLHSIHCEDQAVILKLNIDITATRQALEGKSRALTTSATALVDTEKRLRARSTDLKVALESLDLSRATTAGHEHEITTLRGVERRLRSAYEVKCTELEAALNERDDLRRDRVADQVLVRRIECEIDALCGHLPRVEALRSEAGTRTNRIEALEAERNDLALAHAKVVEERHHLQTNLDLVCENLKDERIKAYQFKENEKQRRKAERARAVATEASLKDLWIVHAKCGEKRKRHSKGTADGRSKRAKTGVAPYANMPGAWTSLAVEKPINSLGLTLDNDNDQDGDSEPKVMPKAGSIPVRKELYGQGSQQVVYDLTGLDSDDEGEIRVEYK